MSVPALVQVVDCRPDARPVEVVVSCVRVVVVAIGKYVSMNRNIATAASAVTSTAFLSNALARI